jgi:hypothetical protein
MLAEAVQLPAALRRQPLWIWLKSLLPYAASILQPVSGRVTKLASSLVGLVLIRKVFSQTLKAPTTPIVR